MASNCPGQGQEGEGGVGGHRASTVWLPGLWVPRKQWPWLPIWGEPHPVSLSAFLSRPRPRPRPGPGPGSPARALQPPRWTPLSNRGTGPEERRPPALWLGLRPGELWGSTRGGVKLSPQIIITTTTRAPAAEHFHTRFLASPTAPWKRREWAFAPVTPHAADAGVQVFGERVRSGASFKGIQPPALASRSPSGALLPQGLKRELSLWPGRGQEAQAAATGARERAAWLGPLAPSLLQAASPLGWMGCGGGGGGGKTLLPASNERDGDREQGIF